MSKYSMYILYECNFLSGGEVLERKLFYSLGVVPKTRIEYIEKELLSEYGVEDVQIELYMDQPYINHIMDAVEEVRHDIFVRQEET